MQIILEHDTSNSLRECFWVRVYIDGELFLNLRHDNLKDAKRKQEQLMQWYIGCAENNLNRK